MKPKHCRRSRLNPDSAVGIDAKSEKQTIRSEANGFLPSLIAVSTTAFDVRCLTFNVIQLMEGSESKCPITKFT
jgi:hypothetical protein